MRVILLERVQSLGQMGEEVTVAPGYARNFLLPRKKALRATENNRDFFQKQRAQLEATSLKKKGEAESVGKKIADLSVVLLRQAGEAGQLYGSVTARDIAVAVTESGCSITREQVEIPQSIKIIGVYPINITLHPEVSVTITANVARSDEEAKTQATAVKNGRPLGAMPPATADDEEKKPRRAREAKPAAEEASVEGEAVSAEASAEGEKKPKKAKKAKADKAEGEAA
ncbi:MAG: 50S ribosomal protein L9 [Alphaproteobacteria bacterium]|nr:MAG: 50S ribosomal protein L9 [Alphaproteobacteria bacterium]